MSEIMGMWLTFILIMCRVLSFLVTAPLFSRRNVPNLIKVGLGFVLSISALAAVNTPFAGSTTELIYSLAAEVACGLVAGILCSWLFQSMQMGGQLMDQQAGFGTASLLDPGSATQSTLMANLIMYISILLFLELNGHHLLVLGIVRSFALVGPGEAVLGTGITFLALRTLLLAYVLLIRVAVPVLVAVVLTDLTLGMVGRTVPQLNVLMLGLPIKAAVAMMVLAAVSPMFMGIGQSMLTGIEDTFASVLRGMTP